MRNTRHIKIRSLFFLLYLGKLGYAQVLPFDLYTIQNGLPSNWITTIYQDSRGWLISLGGISTLRGFRFKEFTGDRMVLANVEYRLNAGANRLHGIPVIEDLNLALFLDTGKAWFTQDQFTIGNFDYLTPDKLKTDVGLAITNRDGNVRLNLAKRIDSEKHDLVITFRLDRDF